MSEDEPSSEDRSVNEGNIATEGTSNAMPSYADPDEMHTSMDPSPELSFPSITSFYTPGIVVSV